VDRDSGTDNAIGGWLQRLVRHHGKIYKIMNKKNKTSPFPEGLDFFDALVFNASLAVLGYDGKSDLSKHLPPRKRNVRHLSNLDCKRPQESEIILPPCKRSYRKKLPERLPQVADSHKQESCSLPVEYPCECISVCSCNDVVDVDVIDAEIIDTRMLPNEKS
jgi:hypothetical protein